MKKLFLLIPMLFIGFLTAQSAVGDKYEGEDFDEAEGARAETSNIGYITNGTWVKFNSVSFDGTEEWIDVAASGTAGGNIEFRLDAPDGTLIGTAEMTGTSGWSDYQIFRADIEQTSGDQVLYLVFTGADGYLFNIDYFKLMAVVPSYKITKSVSPANSGMVVTDIKSDSASQGSNVLFYAQRLAGYTFNHWEDGSGSSISTENPATIKVTGDITVVAVFDATEESYELPIWTFDDDYVVDSSGAVHVFTPVDLPISWRPEFTNGQVYPNNYPATGSSMLTGDADSIFTSLTGENQICRLNWMDANTVDNFTDPTQHEQYLEFQFATTGFENISADLTFSGGQSDVTDYLELVYSVDGGNTWVDGASLYSEAHWNTWITDLIALNGADNKDMVKVRLIGITENMGPNLNFNLDYFGITGTEIITSVTDHSTTAAKITAGYGLINVSVETPAEVIVYTIDGKIVDQRHVESMATIPSQKGIYLVKVGNFVKKISVAK